MLVRDIKEFIDTLPEEALDRQAEMRVIENGARMTRCIERIECNDTIHCDGIGQKSVKEFVFLSE